MITSVEKKGNGSDDSWETLELVCRKVHDRTNHVMHTENPGHETDHQELGSGDSGMERIATQVYIFFHFVFVGPLRLGGVYYESIKRELKRRLIHEYRCNERLKTKTEESTRQTNRRE